MVRTIDVVKTTKDGLCVLVTDQGKLEVFDAATRSPNPNPSRLAPSTRSCNGPGAHRRSPTASPRTASPRSPSPPTAVSEPFRSKTTSGYGRGASNALTMITVHYTDGTTQTVAR